MSFCGLEIRPLTSWQSFVSKNRQLYKITYSKYDHCVVIVIEILFSALPPNTYYKFILKIVTINLSMFAMSAPRRYMTNRHLKNMFDHILKPADQE